MSDFNREQWDELDPEQQWQYFEAMHEAYHEQEHNAAAIEGNAGTLIQCMFDVARKLSAGNALGKRQKTIETTIQSLQIIGTSALLAMPNALNNAEWVHENLEFERLAEQLENDPEFNRDAE